MPTVLEKAYYLLNLLRKKLFKISTLLALSLVTACHPLFCTWDSGYSQLKTKPTIQRLIGQYKLNKQSVDLLSNKGFNVVNCGLELLENGQFKLINAPDIIFDRFGISDGRMTNKEGKWSVSCHDSYDCLIEFEKTFVVPLAEKDKRLAILITIGDGDACEGVVFDKIE